MLLMYQNSHSLADALEKLSLSAADFTHAAHVEAAWLFLGDPERGADAFRKVLLRFVKHHGARTKYHETLTTAYLRLIDARRVAGERWEQFAARNEDLLLRPAEVIAEHYSEQRLHGPEARKRFVAPDRVQLPVPHLEVS